MKSRKEAIVNKTSTQMEQDITKVLIKTPDSTGKCNTATFGKNFSRFPISARCPISADFSPKILHRRRINSIHNFIAKHMV